MLQRKGASTQGVLRRGPDVPGTPALEGPMPLKAAEQGFKGKDVQHVDRETQTSDWQKEFGPKGPQTPEPEISTPRPTKSGAPAAYISSITIGVAMLVVALLGRQ